MAHNFHGIVDERSETSAGWHWLLFSLIDLAGTAVVYDVGLAVLEYPPTWVDTHEEAEIVETAVFEFLRRKYCV